MAKSVYTRNVHGVQLSLYVIAQLHRRTAEAMILKGGPKASFPMWRPNDPDIIHVPHQIRQPEQMGAFWATVDQHVQEIVLQELTA